MASVEACARCAVENASLTKMSPSFARAAGKLRIVLFFALVEAQVLENGNAAGLQRRHRRLRRLADAVVCERNRAARAARPSLSATGLRLNCGIRRALGPAKMRDDDDPGAALGQVLQARARAARAALRPDLAVFDGHVEVGAHEHALALDIEIGGRLELVEIHQRFTRFFAASATLDGVMPKCS